MADVDMNVTFETLNDNVSVDFGSVFVVENGVAVKIVADLYSHDRTYAVGDYVIYNELLYRCLVSIYEPEEFDPEKWSSVKLANDVKNKADKADTYTKEQVDDIIYNILPNDTASGSVANFTTSLALPIKSLEVDVNAVQSAGTPTPATPLPISGRSEISLVHCGANLFDGHLIYGIIDNSTGEVTPNNNNFASENFISVKENTNIVFVCSTKSSGDRFGRAFYDKNQNYISGSYVVDYQTSITVPSGAYYMTFFVPISWYGSTASNNISINYPSTDTSYHAYNGNTEVINLGGTYYGGHFTQDKAGHRQFEVTHGFRSTNDLTFRYSDNAGNWEHPLFYSQIVERKYTSPGVLCSNYPIFNDALATVGNKHLVAPAWGGNNYIYIRDDDYTTVADFVNANQNMIVAFKLATPYVIDLPNGEPINTLVGVNNIYANTGDTSVVFKSSVNDYVSAHSVVSGAKSLGTSKGGSEEQPEEKETEEKEPEVKEHEEEKKEEKELSEDASINKK